MDIIIPPSLRLKYVLAVSQKTNYQEIIDALGLRFAGQVDSILAGDGQITEALADRLCEVFPVLNRDWLLTGDISIMQGDLSDGQFRRSFIYAVCIRPYLTKL